MKGFTAYGRAVSFTLLCDSGLECLSPLLGRWTCYMGDVNAFAFLSNVAFSVLLGAGVLSHGEFEISDKFFYNYLCFLDKPLVGTLIPLVFE